MKLDSRLDRRSRVTVAGVLGLAVCLIPLLGWDATASAQANAPATDTGWPRTFTIGKLEYVVYQPQLDAWDGNRIDCHAAVSVGDPGSETPTFGVAWLAARAEVDKAARLVYFQELRIPRVRFPAVPDGGEAYLEAMSTVLPMRTKAMALDRIEANLSILMAERKVEGLPLRNEPPRIVFSPVPAILLHVDGTPSWVPVEQSTLKRLLNTRPLVLSAPKGPVYLHLFDGWMESPSIEGPWAVSKRPPAELDAVARKLAPTNAVDLLEGQPSDPDDPKTKPSLKKGPVPAVVYSIVPTEIVVTDGEPKYVPVDGTQLLYVENTTGNVFEHSGDRQIYVVLAGRWFRAPGLDGPWQFVPGRALPPDFAAIPDSCPKENVKASVPGTRQAQEAVIANSVPQTAKVDRRAAKLEVAYDGEPRLKGIDGTPLQYAMNSPTPVIMVDAKSWYAVDKGVWFAATGPRGPWVVAASVPAVIYTIPPSSPVHYVTYARVYNSTPDVVYVGYTPGYTGTVVSADMVVVYGTGYAYSPWVGAYYYPPPPTFGYGVAIRYTPWTGWTVGYGFGWSYGAVTVGIGWGCYPAWGPFHYPPYTHGVATPYGAAAWGAGGWARTTGNVYSQYGATSAVTRSSSGTNAATGSHWSNQVGQSYNSATGQLSAGQRSAVGNATTGNYAAGRQGATTNAYTGATAAGRQTASGNASSGQYQAKSTAGGYNPETGNYAAGQKGTVGNSQTGQSATAERGTAGNAKTGQSVDYRGVEGSGGGSVGQVGNASVGKTSGGDVYASKDGDVYKKDSGGSWSKYQPSGGAASPKSAAGGSGSWGKAESGTTSQLDSHANARSTGEQKTSNFQSSPAASGGRSLGGGGSGGASRGGGGRRR